MDLAVKLARGGLVEAHLLLHSRRANRIEHAQDAEAVAVGRVLWHVKRDFDVTHGTQVVNLGGFDGADDGDQVGRVAEIAVVQKELDPRLVAVAVEAVDTSRVEARGATNNTMDLFLSSSSARKRVRLCGCVRGLDDAQLGNSRSRTYRVTLLEQELGEVGAILTCDSCDQRNFTIVGHSLSVLYGAFLSFPLRREMFVRDESRKYAMLGRPSPLVPTVPQSRVDDPSKKNPEAENAVSSFPAQ